jgi:fucokinase
MQKSSADFLQQAYANNWQQYLASLKPMGRGGWDMCVLTASDERQAAMYARQLEWRREAGLLPARMRFRIMADPGGQRIGSGAATLRVLDTLQAEADGLADQRVLIIHSGGDSRRLPHCSVVGKLFARLPRTLPDERASTIFDEFLISLSGLATELPPGVLVASGDVLLVFDHLQLTLRRNGVTGVAAAAPAEMGTHHGVYVRGEGMYRVRAYLHKPPLDQLNHWGAIAVDGSVQIDTGLVWLDADTVSRFAGLVQAPSVAALCRVGGAQSTPGSALNLYGDLLLPLAQSTTYENYLSDASDGPATPEVWAARQHIWQQMRGLPFTVEPLQPAMFIHFGTSHEYWQTVASDPSLRAVCGWTAQVAAWPDLQPEAPQDRLVLINSALEGPVGPGEQPALVIDSHISGAFTWQGGAIVANVRTSQPLTLASDTVVHQVLYPDGYVTRAYGLHDDPKRAFGQPAASFMNMSWADWLREAAIDPAALWPDVPAEERTLWNAQLYPPCADRDESLRLSLLLQQPDRLRREGQGWLELSRVSLQHSFANADGERVLADVMAVEDHVAARRFYHAVSVETPAAAARHLLGHVKDAIQRRSALALDWLAQADTILRLRGYKALSVSLGDAQLENQAFETLAHMVETAVKGAANKRNAPRTIATRADQHQTVRVEVAARIDFGGGWTDTPPYSIERGGAALNAALLLSPPQTSPAPCYPIAVETTRVDQPRLLLESQDIDATLEPQTVGELLAYTNPADPFALHKAALVMRGIVSADDDTQRPIADAIYPLGSGLRLSTQTTIPRGSGLGTSSILAGAVLACLGHLLGVAPEQAQLFDEVLALEQMLTTGGGWQDQVGGLVGGIKLITTPPGLPQAIHIEPVQLSPDMQAELAARLVVIYTGQQRLAKNLLRVMVAKWMARDPRVTQPLREIARLAVEMTTTLDVGNISGLGELLGEHWLLNKHMDPGCTNPFIDRLFEFAGPYINGGKLAGAGGGGFAIMIARDAQAARDLATALAERYPGTPVAVWPCSIPSEGLMVHPSPARPAQ